MDVHKVFLGFDAREKIAYDVCKFSVELHSGQSAKVIPLVHKELRKQGLFTRPWLTDAYTGNMLDIVDMRPFSTEFSHTRFLVPHLMKYKGWALFADSDMIFRCNVKEIFKFADSRYACHVVKHRHQPKNAEKMDGAPQHNYYRKNWSSFVLWNCEHKLNRELTPELVSTKSGSWLHQFGWLPDEAIGDLPDNLNWIDGSSRGMDFPAVIHYTNGGPWFTNCQDVAYAEEWWKYHGRYVEHCDPGVIADIVNIDYGAI